MKISLNWLQKYISIPITPEELSVILTSIGLEVEGMEKVQSIKGGLQGIVIGLVEECVKHPNADRLSLTKVNIGTESLLQIVCGAPNVKAGQKVLVATPGTTIYPLEGNPIKIKKGKIRGEISEGMICSADEIGLGTDHQGIIVLDDDAQVGALASDYYNISTDIIYEIGLTPNRSDATSHIGVARDVSAYLKIHGISDGMLRLPGLQKFNIEQRTSNIDVEVEDEKGCPRYSGVCISNVHIAESPEWLRTFLTGIGVRPVNNLVDITNFVLHEYGQPLHAFDADHISGNKIIVKTLEQGTVFKTLDDQDRKLHAEDLMICDGNGKGMCIAGVFGGIDSGIKDNTGNIFLESAHFDARRIRRTSMRHLLRTDAVSVFEKGSDPNITVDALKRAAILIKELCGGMITSDIVDVYPKPIEKKSVAVEYSKINQLIGANINKERVHDILNALDFEIAAATKEYVHVKVPTSKADVTRPADVIEEVLRIHGFNSVEVDNTLKTIIQAKGKIQLYELRSNISKFLVSRGISEMMGLSLCSSKVYKEQLSEFVDKLVYVNNTSNVHLDVMRPEMICSALQSVSYNQNRRQDGLTLFEFGRVYQKIGEKIKEEEKLGIVFQGILEEKSWLSKKEKKASFFDIKREVLSVFSRLGISGFEATEMDRDARYEYGLTYTKVDVKLAEIGEVNHNLVSYFDIRGKVFYLEFQVENILNTLTSKRLTISQVSKYPGTKRDLALIIDDSVCFQQIEQITEQVNNKLIKQIRLFDVYKNDEQFGSGKKSYAVSFDFEDHSQTLKDIEVDKIMNRLILKLESELGATVRK